MNTSGNVHLGCAALVRGEDGIFSVKRSACEGHIRRGGHLVKWQSGRIFTQSAVGKIEC